MLCCDDVRIIVPYPLRRASKQGFRLGRLRCNPSTLNHCFGRDSGFRGLVRVRV